MQILLSLLAILISIVGYVVYLSKKANRYWKEKGIPYEEPYLFVGNALDLVLMRCTQGESMTKICQKFPKEPVVGYVSFFKPVLMVKDVDYIEKVLIKDFVHFMDRGIELPNSLSPLQVNLFNMTGNKWRATRSKLTPIFTSGRLKSMFNNMTDIGADLNNAIENEKRECVDLKDIMSRFAMDTVGSYGFGINPKSLKTPNQEFEKMGKLVLNFGPWEFIKFLLAIYFPYISMKLKLFFIRTDVQEFFGKIIRKVVNERVENKVQRNDFVDLMLQLKNKGKIEIVTKDKSDDYLGDYEEKPNEKYVVEITDDFLIGQAFVFLVAGFDGFASVLTYMLYHLSKNQDIQEKLRNEITQKIKEHGKLNFDTIKDMTYLDMCLKESLRKRSPAQVIFRVCAKEYTFPNGLTIDKNHTIVVPIFYVHEDPEIYPEPSKYDPERFHPDRHQRPCTLLPFGDGPRMCIAMRFAILQIKYGLVQILTNYKVELNSKTKEPIKIKPRNFITSPKEPIYFNVTKLNV